MIIFFLIITYFFGFFIAKLLAESIIPSYRVNSDGEVLALNTNKQALRGSLLLILWSSSPLVIAILVLLILGLAINYIVYEAFQ